MALPSMEEASISIDASKGTFRHDWDMSRYPFDRQRLVIPFDESDLSAAIVVFEPDLDSSFLSPEVRSRLGEWQISDLELQATVSEEVSTYGLPDAEPVGYAHLDASSNWSERSSWPSSNSPPACSPQP
jgi:hypothetical protein